MYKYESEIYVYDKIQLTIIISIQCSWVKRFFEDDFHDWKVIPLFLIGKHLSRNFKFHNNIDLSKLHEETIIHLFYDCSIVKRIWNQLKSMLSNNINFPISTPQSAIFGFWDLDTNSLS